MQLIIANKNYSSWSMRPWLFLTQHGIPFEEIRIPLYTPESEARLRQYSPSGLVPALLDAHLAVWDSLAICEYLAEIYPHSHGWPADRAARAVARAVSAEIHSGFTALRSSLTMNLKARYRWQQCDAAVMQDIARIEAIWALCRNNYGQQGPWLFGEFSIADAMFAPVATRFVTYSVPVSAQSRTYVDTVYALPAFQHWYDAALRETEVISRYELSDRERLA